LEAAKDFGVDVDGQVLLVDELLVPGLDALVGPVSERLVNQRVGKVDDPLPGQASEVFLVGQVLPGLRIAQSFFDELFDAQAFVLGYREITHSIAVDELSLALDQLLQKVDGMTLVGCKVCTALNCEKVVPRKMLSKAYSTYTSRFERNLEANILAVTCCLTRASPSSAILTLTFILIKTCNASANTECCKDIF